MQEIASKKRSTKKKIIRRSWFWILIGLMGVGVLFFALLPVGMDYGIERYLNDQGVQRATLEDVDFNPITGRMTLTNLSVISEAKSVLQIPKATLDIAWRPFFSKRIVVERIDVGDSQLTVTERKDGRWQIGGIMLSDNSEPGEPSAWNFGLRRVVIKNSFIKYISSQLSSELKIEQAEISKLNSWMPAQSAHLDFKGQLNGSNLHLQADVFPFAAAFAAEGQIKLEGLNLMPFTRLLEPHLKALESRLDADLQFETRQTAKHGIRHHQKGVLKLSQNRTLIAGTDIINEELAWNGALRMDISTPEEELKISADGKLNGSNLSMTFENTNMQIQHDALNWQGSIVYAQGPAAADLNFDGTLAIGPLTVRLPRQKLNFEHAGFQWQGKFNYVQNERNKTINADGRMQLDAVKMESPELNLAEEKIMWKGNFQFSPTALSESQKVMADGTLSGDRLRVHVPTRKLKFEHQGLSWKGRFDYGDKIGLGSLEGKMGLVLKDIEIQHTEIDQPLLNAERANFERIQIQSLDEINVSGIEFNGLKALAPPGAEKSPSTTAPLFSMQELKFKDINLSKQKALAIDTINFEALNVLLHRDAQGKWSAIDRLRAIQKDVFPASQTRPSPIEKKAPSETGAKEKSTAFEFGIRQVEISGDSKLRFEDETVSPVFDIDLSLQEALLTNLDNRQSEKPAELKLTASDADGARLSLKGTMQPFAEPFNLDWIGKITALELPLLSPYVIQSTGYRFVRGEMQADVPLKISQSKINGEIDLTLFNPRIEKIKAKDAVENQKSKIHLNMTLDSALKLLSDKQNNVKLEIPISGNINDPQFSIADAVNKVLSKTLQKSALTYLKYMLGPYGIGISVAELAYKHALKIRLNPIYFAPGSDELDKAATDYLQRVAAIMKDYTEVQVVVCSTATESDRGALSGSPSTEPATSPITDAVLLELARNRTERIEDHLVKSHEIEANRIIACNPEIDGSAGAKPRAKLEI